jgi:hypothetical protein
MNRRKENTWRRLNDMPLVPTVEEVVTTFKKSMDDYPKTVRNDWNDQVFIDDILYCLGIAIDKEKYQYGQGYRKFKADLIMILEESK